MSEQNNDDYMKYAILFVSNGLSCIYIITIIEMPIAPVSLTVSETFCVVSLLRNRDRDYSPKLVEWFSIQETDLTSTNY